MMIALRTANVEMAKLFLDQGADVNARDGSDATMLVAMMTQAYGKQLEIVNLMLDKTADVNAKD